MSIVNHAIKFSPTKAEKRHFTHIAIVMAICTSLAYISILVWLKFTLTVEAFLNLIPFMFAMAFASNLASMAIMERLYSRKINKKGIGKIAY